MNLGYTFFYLYGIMTVCRSIFLSFDERCDVRPYNFALAHSTAYFVYGGIHWIGNGLTTYELCAVFFHKFGALISPKYFFVKLWLPEVINAHL